MTCTFCPAPWNFQAIQNNGTIRICCHMNVTKDRGTLTKSDGSPYNAASDDMTDARNADLIKEVRSYMLADKWHPGCERCRSEEESGNTSKRMNEIANWPDITIDRVASATSIDGEINVDMIPVSYYDLRFGNFCNLACRMCGPEDSHTWYKEWISMFGEEWEDTHGKIAFTRNDKGRWATNAYDWHDSNSFWQQLEEKMNDISMVYMAGGEPMLINRHYEFLQKCIDNDVAKNITLEYNTNLTNVHDRAIAMWKHFKKVNIGASIDGMGKVLEYQRHPAKWETIERNLRIIDSLADNIVAWISTTVTATNVFHIPDFILWEISQNFKKVNKSSKSNPTIRHHMCHKPWSSSVQVLPLHMKKKITDYYNSRRDDFQSYDKNIVKAVDKIFNGIIKFMNSVDRSDKMDEFVEFNLELDRLRNQHIVDVIPEYYKIFNGRINDISK